MLAICSTLIDQTAFGMKKFGGITSYSACRFGLFKWICDQIKLNEPAKVVSASSKSDQKESKLTTDTKHGPTNMFGSVEKKDPVLPPSITIDSSVSSLNQIPVTNLLARSSMLLCTDPASASMYDKKNNIDQTLLRQAPEAHTPLHTAVGIGQSLENIKKLLENGADVFAQDLSGKTAVRIASTRWLEPELREAILMLLVSARKEKDGPQSDALFATYYDLLELGEDLYELSGREYFKK